MPAYHLPALLFFIFGLSPLTARESVAYLAEGSVNIKKKYPDTKESRWLTQFYREISFPAIARANGVGGNFAAHPTVRKDGVLSVDSVFLISSTESEQRAIQDST